MGYLNKKIKKILGIQQTPIPNIWKTNFLPPGHYYSPHIDHDWVKKHEQQIFDKQIQEIPGVDLNTEKQLALLESLSKYYPLLDFPETKQNSHHYYYQNQYFSYSDAISLSCLMLHLKPKRIIEVGSGYSSAVMVDINKKHFNNKIELMFIEPYPEERLNKVLSENTGYKLIQDFVQNISVSLFQQLEANDILFIDSSHVSKTGSDVNYLFFEIMPKLMPGVIIHIHDVFYPFEYPKEWVYQDRAWNEAYLLRAFLQYNSNFKIEFFNSFLEIKFREWYENNMPLCLNKHEKWKENNGEEYLLNTTGQSIYIQKLF